MSSSYCPIRDKECVGPSCMMAVMWVTIDPYFAERYWNCGLIAVKDEPASMSYGPYIKDVARIKEDAWNKMSNDDQMRFLGFRRWRVDD